jgi:hypothetical protein
VLAVQPAYLHRFGAYLNTKSNTITQLQYVYTGQAGGTGLNGSATYSYAVPANDGGNWWTYAAANIFTSTSAVPSMPWRNPATATEGMMWGRVQNGATGLYVDDATVTVSGGPTVKTDGNGYYVATLIPAAAAGTVHSTVASKSGMISQTNAGSTVLAGDVVRYDFILNQGLAAPGSLSATTVSTSQVNLAWIDNATNETGYVVSRSLTAGGPYADIATLAANSVGYTNTGLNSSTTYYYVTRATNASTASPNSNEAAATTQTPPTPPSITGQPQNQTVPAGSTVVMGVTASGTLPLSYQWRWHGTNLPGASGTSLTLNNAAVNQSGPYSVRVTNVYGSTTSQVATLTVTPIFRPEA